MHRKVHRSRANICADVEYGFHITDEVNMRIRGSGKDVVRNLEPGLCFEQGEWNRPHGALQPSFDCFKLHNWCRAHV